MADFDADLFVIGGGSGGVRAARIAAGYGAKVFIAEEYRIGGTCVIRGCVPKKLMVYAANVSREVADAAGLGWAIPSARFDWAALATNRDNEVARLEAAYMATIKKSGAHLVRARATFEDEHTLRLSTGELVRARHILIATGSTPNFGAAIPGIEHVISSNEVFHLPEFPDRVLIQGGGYIGIEFACIFAGLGANVTLLCRGENILRGFDDDVRHHVRNEMEKAGIKVKTGCRVERVERAKKTYRSGGMLTAHLSNASSVTVDQVMFAIGRSPNITGFGLEKVGVELSSLNGGVAVNAYSQTNVPHIYAVGDVTNRINLTPVAVREGHAFADTVFGKKPTRIDHTDIPTAVFSVPEIGTVGLTEVQACTQFAHVNIYKTAFRPMKATVSGRDEHMMMKLVVDANSDRVVGCHIVGSGAAEIVQAVAIAIRLKATKTDFDATMALHPTAAEELVSMRVPTERRVRQFV